MSGLTASVLGDRGAGMLLGLALDEALGADPLSGG